MSIRCWSIDRACIIGFIFLWTKKPVTLNDDQCQKVSCYWERFNLDFLGRLRTELKILCGHCNKCRFHDKHKKTTLLKE